MVGMKVALGEGEPTVGSNEAVGLAEGTLPHTREQVASAAVRVSPFQYGQSD